MNFNSDKILKLHNKLAAALTKIGFRVSDVKSKFEPDTQTLRLTVYGKSDSLIPNNTILHCVEKLFGCQSLEIAATKESITIDAN